MSKKIAISIPTPCHENWDGMTPSEKGRFCGSCQKEVVDFTSMTDGEVYKFFTNNIGKSVCGHTLSTQLEAVYTAPPSMQKRKPWWWSAVAAILVFFTKSEAKAQTKPVIKLGTVPSEKEIRIRGNLAINYTIPTTTIKGKVIDEKGQPIAYASIGIKGTDKGVRADLNGNYTLTVQDKTVLEINSIGYEPKEQLIAAIQGEITLVTTLPVRVLGGLSIEIVTTITGIVTDENGNPIASASVSTKNREKSTITDSKGHFKISIKDEDILKITAVGYEQREQKITPSQKELQIVLPMSPAVMLTGIMIKKTSNEDDIYIAPDIPKHVAQIAVTDGSTGEALSKVQLSITKNYETTAEKTNSKGLYKIRKIKEWETVSVTATALGYKSQTLIIKGNSFKQHKQTVYIALEKEVSNKVLTTVENPVLAQLVNRQKLSAPVYPGSQMLCGSSFSIKNCWISSTTPTPKKDTLSIINEVPPTAPLPAKTLEEVVVIGTVCPKKYRSVAGGITVVSSALIEKPVVKEQAKKIIKISSEVSVAPNPVASGGTITLQIKGFEKKQVMISMISQSGQVVQQQSIYVPVNQFSFQWLVAPTLPAGIYILQVAGTDSNNHHAQTKIMVQ